jgi:hypothetical protein
VTVKWGINSEHCLATKPVSKVTLGYEKRLLAIIAGDYDLEPV